MSVHKVFVYGTLNKGNVLTHRLPGYVMFKVKGTNFDFPYIQAWPMEGKDGLPEVYGRIIQVDDEELKRLDAYENVSSKLYIRVKALAFVLDKKVSVSEEVEVYVGGPALACPPIPSGIWVNKE